MHSIEAEFEKTVQFLYSQLPVFQRDGSSAYKKDLSNTLRLCEFLNNPQHQFKSVHVAGTNGKGSSSHYLAAVCQQAGYKTGLYTSPHLKTFSERIKVNGIEIEKSFVVSFVDKIKPLLEEIQPSFFEITVAMAFDYFAHQEVDIAIIEVGMGGRLDSTNVILPEVSLITNISMDHQQWLGDTIDKIAKEKAGIIKDNRPIVISENQPETIDVFKETATSKHATLYFAEDYYKVNFFEFFTVLNKDSKTYQLSASTGAAYQTKNLTGVLKVIDLLNERGFEIKLNHIKSGLESAFEITGLKGRWQKLGEHPFIFCDVGHNEAGVDYVLGQINTYEFNKLYIIIGMVNDKDADAILKKFPVDAYYYFCQPSIPRAMKAEKLAEYASSCNLNGEIVRDVNEAIEIARNRSESNDFIFIGGSNFVVADIENL